MSRDLDNRCPNSVVSRVPLKLLANGCAKGAASLSPGNGRRGLGKREESNLACRAIISSWGSITALQA